MPPSAATAALRIGGSTAPSRTDRPKADEETVGKFPEVSVPTKTIPLPANGCQSRELIGLSPPTTVVFTSGGSKSAEAPGQTGCGDH